MTIHNLISFLGLFILMILAWSVSTHRRMINWRAVGWGLGLQLTFGWFVFRSDTGRNLFLVVNDGINALIAAAMKGPEFVFGGLTSTLSTSKIGLGFILATQGLPTIIVASALVSLLYYFGLMSWVVRGFAYVFTRFMRISGAESLNAASNIFLGIESTLVIRPHLAAMTESELCVVLTACMATVASNMMALYVSAMNEVFPTIAGHLMAASILSAPASILMAKLVIPETGQPKTLGIHIKPYYEKEKSLFEAIVNGATSGLQLVLGIVALLVAVVGLLGVADWAVGALGAKINFWTGAKIDWSLRTLVSYLFYPLSWSMGVPEKEIPSVSRLLSMRLIVTELPSYFDLAGMLKSGTLSPRTGVIAAYSLCGFAHFASIGIFVGGLAAMVPERKVDLARMAPRALWAATLACLMTGCIAGLFSSGDAMQLLGLNP